jgi:hypothetical protein
MWFSARRLIGRVARTAAFYRAMPAGPLRAFGGLQYHYARHDWPDVINLARTDLNHTTKFRSSGLLAARAAFFKADDDVAESIIKELLNRFPAEPRIFDLRADIRRFQSRPADALADAEHARFLIPSSRNAVAKVMRYSYLAHSPDVADRMNLEELRRYPRSTKLYSTAAKGCRDPRQYEQLLQIWRAHDEPASIISKVDALALAADRAGEIEAACQLYRDATERALEAGGAVVEAPRSNTVVTVDVPSAVHDVLNTAGIPYVFIGDSALALARFNGGQRVELVSEIDVGVFEDDWDQASLERAFSSDLRFALRQEHPRASVVGVIHRSNVGINIFRLYRDSGKLWRDYISTRRWNTPFTIDLHSSDGHVFPLPSDLTTYLQEDYGDRAALAADSSERPPNTEVTWPGYERLDGLRRAYRRVRVGDLAGAANELAIVKEDELASVIEVRRGG